jgi:hypothetical protein
VAQAEAELAEEIKYRTSGGRRPSVDKEWGNRKLPPPPSASDPTMPAHRRLTEQFLTSTTKEVDGP